MLYTCKINYKFYSWQIFIAIHFWNLTASFLTIKLSFKAFRLIHSTIHILFTLISLNLIWSILRLWNFHITVSWNLNSQSQTTIYQWAILGRRQLVQRKVFLMVTFLKITFSCLITEYLFASWRDICIRSTDFKTTLNKIINVRLSCQQLRWTNLELTLIFTTFTQFNWVQRTLLLSKFFSLYTTSTMFSVKWTVLFSMFSPYIWCSLSNGQHPCSSL